MIPVLGDTSTWPEAYSEIIMPGEDEIIAVPNNLSSEDVEVWIETVNETLGIQ